MTNDQLQEAAREFERHAREISELARRVAEAIEYRETCDTTLCRRTRELRETPHALEMAAEVARRYATA